MQEIKEGSKVRLKSGSPLMTVDKVSVDKIAVTCVWFVVSESVPQWDNFRKTSLVVVETEEETK